MKRIEEYLKNINQKEKIMLYATFPVLIFIGYYNFIYNSFVEQEKKLNKKKSTLIKNISSIKSDKKKYKILQKKYYRLQTDINSLTQDYRYSKISFNSLNVIKLSDAKFLKIIQYLLEKAKDRNLDISININKNIKHNKHFNNAIAIIISGNGNYVDFVKYIRDIENIDSLSIIKQVNISVSKVKNVLEQNKFIIKFDLVGIK